MDYIQPKIDFSEKIIKEALNKFERVGLAFSGGSDSVVILSMTLPFSWKIPVIFVNTQYEFPETYEYVNKLKKEWNLNLHEFKAEKSKYEYFIEKYGEDTKEFYYNCCMYHKIEPLMRGIKTLNLDALIVGIRGVEHLERAKETYISYKKDLNPPHTRVHPILDWTRQDVIDYCLLFEVPVNPMYSRSYTSLGCKYCTKPNLDPKAHERAGRARLRELIKAKLKKEGYN